MTKLTKEEIKADLREAIREAVINEATKGDFKDFQNFKEEIKSALKEVATEINETPLCSEPSNNQNLSKLKQLKKSR